MNPDFTNIINFEHVSNHQILNFSDTGFHYKFFVKSDKIFDFVELIKRENFNLNLITGFDEDSFKIIYIFSNILKNRKIIVEVKFENKKVESIECIFENAAFYENDINEKYGLIFSENIKQTEKDIDDFVLNSSSFEMLTTEPYFFDVLTCGQIVKDIYPETGLYSRYLENSARSEEWSSFLVKSSRIDSYSGFFSNFCFCGVIEKALGIDVPKRAGILRIIISELSRISFNLKQISQLFKYLGLNAQGSFFEILEENILDLIEYIAGKRLTDYFRVGGVSKDVGSDFEQLYYKKTQNLLKDLDEIRNNGIVNLKLKNNSLISKEQAYLFGMTGHNLRSTGYEYDVRNNDKYGLYDLFHFKPSIRNSGDGLDRLSLKIDEIFLSHSLIEKSIKLMKKGPVLTNVKSFEIPYGDYFYSVESPRGRLSYYLKGCDSVVPMDVKIETPSISAFCFFKKLNGISLNELPLNIFNLCFSMAEIDK